MAERTRDGRNSEETAVDRAISQLESSMSGLSRELTTLEGATRRLERSAQALSDQQEQVSKDLSQTAEELRDRSHAAITQTSDRSAPADD